ncbi:MAG: zinc-dependent metalloprotease family protein [Cocleimonas sp.]
MFIRKKFIRFYLLQILALLIFSTSAIADDLWRDIDIKSKSLSKQTTRYNNARYLKLDRLQMQYFLHNTLNSGNQQISLPLPNKAFISIQVTPVNILPESLSDKFPSIKSFRIKPNKEIISGRLSLNENDFHGMLQMRNGETYFIDPLKANNNVYVSYKKSNQQPDNSQTFSCGAKPSANNLSMNITASRTENAHKEANSLVTYKIAIAATGEYTAKHGGTVKGALSAINTTLNRINQVFERDLGIRLKLVENNHLLIHTNADSDPYFADSQVGLVRQNQDSIDHIIGNENYDLGHLFTAKGGGLAAIGSVCDSYDKGKGISGISNPYNDAFNLDFVAHEIGHQLGATHTFNGTQGLCGGDSRNGISAFEPGSGSTIMSYAGFCGQDNLQAHTDAMFHIGSIKQIQSYIRRGQGSRCGIHQSTQNQVPQSNAGKNYTIPARTPFELKGAGTDSEGDELVYSWQQADAGKASEDKYDMGDNALFRTYMPSRSSNRVFPSQKDIVEHSHTGGETLPNHERTLKFSLVTQDGYNPSQSDEMTVNIKRTGSRFSLHIPRSQYTTGISYKLQWNVANTNQAPINCHNVDISLSTDGGYLFDQKLANNIANIGESWITIPADFPLTSKGRFKINCSDNIFFAISYRNFFITDQIDPITEILEDGGLPELDLLDKKENLNEASTDITTKESTTGGGPFNPYFLILILFLSSIIKKRRGVPFN